MPSLDGKAAGCGALSAFFTARSNNTLVVYPTDVGDEANADRNIAACALVGGLKLESKTTSLFACSLPDTFANSIERASCSLLWLSFVDLLSRLQGSEQIT